MDNQKTIKEGFLLYVGFYESIKHLSDEDLGKLFRLIFHYQTNPENPVSFSVTPAVEMAFNFIKNQFRVDAIKYEKRIIANRENGKKGGRPKKSEDNE